MIRPRLSKKKGFTVIELIVAVAVTAMLSGMLLLISNQVLETQSKSIAELERNQVAHFILDQIQEDLQCALFRNDGNAWMAIAHLIIRAIAAHGQNLQVRIWLNRHLNL